MKKMIAICGFALLLLMSCKTIADTDSTTTIKPITGSAPVVEVISIQRMDSIDEQNEPEWLETTEEQEVAEELEAPETNENELIEAALFESGYFREDIPLDGDTQAELHAACDEFGISYELAVSVIHQETNFQNINGDNGRSIGYCQIQPRYWSGLMEEIGVRDLTIPYDNFRTMCAILSGHIKQYGSVESALTAYNTGRPGTSRYARQVLAYMNELEGEG